MQNGKQRIIVTSALPYAHALPHLGNFIGSILPADAYYKYLTMEGEDAIFICGSDQHGTPIELRAIKEGVPPGQLADSVHEKIKSMLAAYGCTPTYYEKPNHPKGESKQYCILRNAKQRDCGYYKIDKRQPKHARAREPLPF